METKHAMATEAPQAELVSDKTPSSLSSDKGTNLG